MKIRYFQDTDTLFIEFGEQPIAETRELDENTILDVDADGRLLAVTVEHASKHADLSRVTVEGIAA